MLGAQRRLNNSLPYLLGVGLAIMPVQRVYSVAVAGLAVVLFISLYVTYQNWKKIRETPRILLFLVTTLILLAVFVPGSTMYAKFYALAMVCVFFAANVLGPKTLTPLGIGAIIGGVGTVIVSILTDFTRGGGIYHAVGYNQAAGVILLGAVFWRHKYQWLVVPIAIVGALATGADEALVIIATVGFVVLLRGDLGRKILPTVAVVVLLPILLLLPTNPMQKLWETVPAAIHVAVQDGSGTTEVQQRVEGDLLYRWQTITNSLKDVRPFGHGYAPDNVDTSTIHNVPVRVLYELGPLGVLGWLGLILYGLLKTTWKYSFVAVIGASLFDHFMWTQLAPWFFVLLGVCSWLPNEKDRMFG